MKITAQGLLVCLLLAPAAGVVTPTRVAAQTDQEALAAYKKGVKLHVEGKHAEAIAELEVALQLYVNKEGEVSLSVANCCTVLGLAHEGAGEYGKAEPFLLRSLRIAEAKRGNDDVWTATSLNHLGILYYRMGQYAKAEPLLLRGLEIREAKLGKNHSDIATNLGNLGSFYATVGRYGKAEAAFLRSVAIREAKLGKDDPELAKTLDNLGSLYSQMGQPGKAEPLLVRALQIFEAKLGKDHFHTGIAAGNLANFYYQIGQYDKAAPLLRRGVETAESKWGKDHPRITSNLLLQAFLDMDRNQYADAEPLLLRILQIREAKLGNEHPGTATALYHLARLYTETGEYAKAETLYQRSLDIRKARLGKYHPDVIRVSTGLARLYTLVDRPRDAMRMFDQARRASRHFQRSILTVLADGQLFEFFQGDQAELHKALALAESHSLRAEDRERAAAWLINAKGVVQEAVAERILLARDNPDPAFARQLVDLVAVRQEMAKLAMTGNLAGKEQEHRARLQALTEQEKLLSAKLRVADYRLTQEDPWVDLDDVRRRMAKNEILVDLVRMAIYDFHAKDKTKRWQPARYLALLTPKSGDVELVDLGLADTIDAAVRDARKALEASPSVIRTEGEIEAEKLIKTPLQKLAKLVLNPLRPYLDKYERWTLCPDGNLWLVPWAALPLDEKAYVVEKHQLRYVTSGRDLVLNPLKLDHKSSAPAIFADPDFDLSPTQLAIQEDELRGAGEPHLLQGRRLGGRIEQWNVSFEFKEGGKVVIRDEDAKGEVAGEGSWSLKGDRLTITTALSQFVGTVHGNRIAGQRTRKNGESPDNWSLTVPADSANAGVALGLFDIRSPRQLGKVKRLPGTAAEAEAIKHSLTKYAGAPQQFLDAKATVARFQALKGPRVLVVSTHGFFLPNQEVKPASTEGYEAGKPHVIPELENPLLRSGLLLAGCNRADKVNDTGILTGLEILGTDLRGTELVVLSACETGLGDVRNGEGVAGLRQAFHLAGAQTVVASLWQISDRETVAQMNLFFAKLSDGQSKSEALREAQLGLLRQRRDRHGAAHPFYWAAFTVTGR